MLKPDLKAKIDELWNRFWASGIANPLSAIEQISYLIFLKRIEEIDDSHVSFSNENNGRYRSIYAEMEICRWSNLKALISEPDLLLDTLKQTAFPFLKSIQSRGNTFSDAMNDAVFLIPKPSLLVKAFELIDNLPISDQNFDVSGDIYEYLLSRLNLAGRNGQFRTPRHIIRVMAEMVNPDAGEYVCDPSAGTGGFLVGAYQHVLKSLSSNPIQDPEDGSWHNLTGDLIQHSNVNWSALSGDHFVGYDFDTTMVRLGLMNMMLHGINNPSLKYQDVLSHSFSSKQRFQVILANPPFTGTVDQGDINRGMLTLPTSKTELLFVELCLQLLTVDGRCAMIIPEGVLFGSTNAHRQLRQGLIESNRVQAVVSLPGGCFKPYAGVKTAILYFTRGRVTDNVWFYEVTGDGYTLDDRRLPDPKNNDLRYVAQAFRILVEDKPEEWESPEARKVASDRSWTATIDQIRDSDYSLAPGTYRPLEIDDEVFEDPFVILANIAELEAELKTRIQNLHSMLPEVVNA